MTPDPAARLRALIDEMRSRDFRRLGLVSAEIVDGWADELEAALSVGAAGPAQDSEKLVRERLWINHGCPFHALYGDDGEMQCNAESCRLDFKREPLPSLILKLVALGRLHAGIYPVAGPAQEGKPAKAECYYPNEHCGEPSHGGYPSCSLRRGHGGEHKAYTAHHITPRMFMLAWPPEASPTLPDTQEPS